MYRLTGYFNSDNIIIDPHNNIAYHYYPGDSYKDKLKNGLTLEQVYEQEDAYFENKHESIVEPIVKTKQHLKQKYDEDCKCYDYNINKNTFNKRKQKPINKRKNKDKRKNKKYSVRQNGYIDKLFNREQHLPETYEEEKHGRFYWVYHGFKRSIPLKNIPDDVLKKNYPLYYQYKIMNMIFSPWEIMLPVPFSLYSEGTWPLFPNYVEYDYEPGDDDYGDDDDEYYNYD